MRVETATVTVPYEVAHASKCISFEELHAATLTFNSPFFLYLEDGEVFAATEIIRHIPKRRLVAFGSWQGKQVVAKIFFDAQHAKRHFEKEKRGIKTLQQHKIPTPALYYEGLSKDKRIYILIFERILGSYNLHTLWTSRVDIHDCLPILQAIMIELATQHVFGVLQLDLHLKNFLLTEKTIYTLDGEQISCLPQLMPKKTSMNHLALFLSQLGVGVDEVQENLFRYYAKARGWILKKEDILELFFLIKKWNDKRWARYERKIFRESSDFTPIQHGELTGMLLRSAAQPELLAFLKSPDLIFDHKDATLLKAGRSATMIKVTLDERELVIKRYNMKNIWHHLRRSLRTTRARNVWRLAHKLNLFDIHTIKPIAFLEKKYFGLNGKSYLVAEYIAGQHAGKYFSQKDFSPEKLSKMVKSILGLLKGVAKLEITHGDLKITNLIIDERERPVLIDLDGASEHATLTSLKTAWQKEIKRLLDNFHDQPEIQKSFRLYL